MNIPDKLLNFECYEDSRNMAGIVDVTLPTLTFMTTSITGAGIGGEVDSPAVGHVQSLTATFNWRSLTRDNISYAAPRTYNFTIMGDVQFMQNGNLTSQNVTVVMRCKPKSLNLGTLAVASNTGTSIEYEVDRILMTVAGARVLLVDKFNYIFEINGIDYLARSRRNIGR